GGRGGHAVRVRRAAAEGTGQDRGGQRAARGRRQEGERDGQGAGEGGHEGQRGRLRRLTTADRTLGRAATTAASPAHARGEHVMNDYVLLVVGSANAELVIGVDRRQAAGETVRGSDLAVH